MRIYVKNIPAKFYPDPIWNDVALDLLDHSEQWSPKQQEQDE